MNTRKFHLPGKSIRWIKPADFPRSLLLLKWKYIRQKPAVDSTQFRYKRLCRFFFLLLHPSHHNVNPETHSRLSQGDSGICELEGMRKCMWRWRAGITDTQWIEHTEERDRGKKKVSPAAAACHTKNSTYVWGKFAL